MTIERRTMGCALCGSPLVELSPHNWVHESQLLSTALLRIELSVAA